MTGARIRWTLAAVLAALVGITGCGDPAGSEPAPGTPPSTSAPSPTPPPESSLVSTTASTTTAATATSSQPPATTLPEAVTIPTFDLPAEYPIVAAGGPSAATDLAADVECSGDATRAGIADLRWEPAGTPGSEQRIAVTLYRADFDAGPLVVSEALDPSAREFAWRPLTGQANHFWSVLTLHPDGWHAAAIAMFTGPGCVADFQK